MYHIHHIIPKHMGGTDDKNNLIELPIWAHAEVHKRLWEVYGKLEDKLAYCALSGKTEEIEKLNPLRGPVCENALVMNPLMKPFLNRS